MRPKGKMKAVLLRDKGKLVLEEWDVPPVGEGEVLVAMRRVGVCGSDVHFWKDGRIGSAIIKFPWILGHETAGVVAEVGKGVTSLREGDRVVVEPGTYCGKCRACQNGRYNLCAESKFMGSPSLGGAFCEYVAHPGRLTYRIPEGLSYEAAVLAEPLNLALYAFRRVGMTPGTTALVTGAGTIGLTTLLMLRACGVHHVFISDVRPDRLAVAGELGAAAALNPDEADLGDAVRELTDGEGVDCVFECSGAPQALVDALNACRRGGTIATVGMFHPAEFSFPFLELLRHEVDVCPIMRYAKSYRDTLAMLGAGLIKPERLATHHFPLASTPEAFEWAEAGRDGAIKVMIDVSED